MAEETKMGRPPLPESDELRREINWELIENLCKIQCTQEEIQDVIGIDKETIDRYCKRKHGITFSTFFKQKKNGGRASLRRSQWLNATANNNTTMQIWLGKQYLDQSDKVESKNENTEVKRLVIQMDKEDEQS